MDSLITKTAATVAAAHVADGWNLKPKAYRLHTFPDDRATLAAALGRQPTRDDEIAFERAMWEALPQVSSEA